ncbi:UNVERIFIED_CONTAM: hypothetical protein GTU68_034467 [Idotea baltica]|nr:hypothetical protein [Idotea baltica]
MMQEFKEFAVKGNMVDMAVGIIIGGAFGKIISSLVEKVIMPPIGVALGGTDFSNLGITLVLGWGAFAQTCIDFTIVAFAIFMMVKVINSLKRAEPEAAEEPAGPTQEEILMEIRDLLATENRKQANS